MKIIKLKSENIKKIKAIEIEPRDNTVIISGKNAQGKSSVLDSIWWALGGTKNIQEKPIRTGEKRAEVTLEMDDIIVTRKWTSDNTSYLQITNNAGKVFPSPQKMLDKLIGDLSFDPLEFAKTEKEKQIKILLNSINFPPFHKKLEEISGVAINGTEQINESFNKAYKNIFENRTIVNREIKNLQTKFDSISIPVEYKNKNIESISISELYQKKEDFEIAIKRQNERNDRIIFVESEIKKLTKELAELKKEKSQETYSVEQLETNLEQIKEQIQNADEINKIATAKKEKKDIEIELNEKLKTSESLTQKLNKIKNYKEEIIKQSEMPLKGLDFTDGEVIYNNIPFNQLSASEQLKVSLAIAMSLNPEIKIIRIMDGSLLDNESLEIIKMLAEKKDYQVWMEVVDDSGKLGIYIEDGEVKEDNQ